MKYRPEIDGLRAIAVIPVIFFHAGLSFFSGGYVGVDIFFVISGYLITTIILNDIETGKFSIANFYERRIRRILPALVIVMSACLPFAYYWLLPTQLTEFSQSLIAVSMFYSNMFFSFKTGYFETTSELKPLLHTWSLAVEEQYYLLFPLLLIFLSRFGKRIMLILLALLGISSLVLSQWISGTHESINFYFLPTRLWEILIGSFVAFYFFYRNKEKGNLEFSPVASQILSGLGLCLILYSNLAFNENTPFPSFYTLFPTLGTALIILFTSEKTITRKILGSKLFVGIGLISYSAYLWHQPIFAFTKIMSIKKPNNQLMFALGILSLGLAYLSWKYVETPFRDKAKYNRKRIFQLAALSSTVIIAIGVAGYIGKGFGNRIAPNGISYARLDALIQPNYGLSKACDSSFSPSILKQCETDRKPEVVVWGDSFAMHLLPGILASKPDVRLVQITKSMCGPVVDLAVINPTHSRNWAEGCINHNNRAIEWIQLHPSVRYVVLGSIFSQYLSGDNTTLLVDGKVMPLNSELVQAHFETTLATLTSMGVKPIIFAPPPENGENIGNCLVKDAFYFSSLECRIEINAYKDSQKEVLDLLDKIEKKYPVIRVSNVLCNETFCNTKLDNVYIYGYSGHYSAEGSTYLGKKMDFYKLITSK